jgi:hypothetical protein
MLEGLIRRLLAAEFVILCGQFWGPLLGGIASLAITLAALFSFISCMNITQIVVARHVDIFKPEAVFLARLLIRSMAVRCSAFEFETEQ